MSKVIIYNENGNLRVVRPVTPLQSVTEAVTVAEREVPTGLPFKIVNDSEIPTDRTYRDSWMINDNELTDGVGE